MFDVWIQRADLEAEETICDAPHEVIRLLFEYEWDAELAKQTQLESEGIDNCPPGLGIVSKDQRILHICPGPEGALVFFHYPEQMKILGLFKTKRQVTAAGNCVPRTLWPDLVEMFMSEMDHGIREILGQYAQ